MEAIYVYHNALNCLLFEHGHVLVEGLEYYFGQDELGMYQDFLEQFWCKHMEADISRLIYPTNLEKRAADLSRQEVALYANSLTFPLKHLQAILTRFNARLYGSKVDPERVYTTVRRYMSKINGLELAVVVDGSFVMPGLEWCEKEFLEDVLYRRLTEQNKFVVKAEYGKGGLGSSIINDKRAIENYLRTVSRSSFLNALEIPNNNKFLIEPFLYSRCLPSQYCFIYDDRIIQHQCNDRFVQGLSYYASLIPGRSRAVDRVQAFTLRVCSILQEEGYRGPADFEFMEDYDGNLTFCEINARYPVSHYPHQYSMHDRQLLLCTFRSGETFSAEAFFRLVGDHVYNRAENRGIIPMTIPNYRDPLHTFSLLFVENDIVDIKRSYEKVAEQLGSGPPIAL